MKNTFLPTKNLLNEKTWYLIVAENKTLGRVATQISQILIGKHKYDYSYHLDTGDYVVVINAEKIIVSGQKDKMKKYYSHSGRPGGMKIKTFEQLKSYMPERIIEKAVQGMLPKGSLGKNLYRKLKVYSNDEHPHTAQQPILIL
jgi:large subunit ribosomal protein L13